MTRLSILAVLIALTMTGHALADDGTVRVTMSTSQGEIGIDLYLDRAPITAGNFLQLVDNGDLDGGSFYRVVSYENDNGNPGIEVIQGGLGSAGDGFDTIDHETTEQTGIRHTDGVISMARGAVGTASTEFFICIGDQPGLDYGQPRNADEQGFATVGCALRLRLYEGPDPGGTRYDFTRVACRVGRLADNGTGKPVLCELRRMRSTLIGIRQLFRPG